MIEFLQSIDTWLFHLVNSGLSNSVFDKIMPFITTNSNWTLVYVFLFSWLLWKGGRNGRICVIVLIVTIVIADQVNSSLLKEWIARSRPCHTLSDINLLVPCGGGKSMPSSHAVNSFAAAIVLAHYYKHYFWVWFGIAIAVSFSRVYVGVHYPFDIIAGAGFGILVGYLVIKLETLIENQFLKRKKALIN
ncbi:MAG: phosphatase PAP2 family protein [Bacteroidetes bacterium]|nr:MAG: phosphatase PAP2 family protein [Bacteroidota bacterium]